MKYFLGIVCLLSSILTHAQELFHINYTISDGLPSNNIYSVTQDKEGYLWFTTDVGIVKYDSKTFQLFNSDDGLSDNEVFQIKEDSKGRKWMLTLNGIPSFILNGKIYNDENSDLIKRIKSRSIMVDFHEDAHGTIYLAYKKSGITTIDKNQDISTKSRDKTTTSGVWTHNNSIFSINSIGIYNISKNEIHALLKYNTTLRVYHHENHHYYSCDNVLYKISTDNLGKPLLQITEPAEIINMYHEDQSTIWLCTRTGLYLFENNIQKAHFFKDDIISSIIKDSEGNYWISTLNRGILFVPSFEIKVFKNKNGDNLKINSISVKPENEIWLGGFQNDFYIKKKHQFSKHQFKSSWRKDNIMNIRFFENSTYVVGKSGVQKIQGTKKSHYLVSVNDILINKDTIYTATSNTSKIKSSEFGPAFFPKMYTKMILKRRTNVLALGDDEVWLGSNSGLFVYNGKDSIQSLGNNFKSLETSIKDLYFDFETNTLIVASASQGIIVLKNKKIIHAISTTSGLNNNTSNTIAKIKTNTYLVGTNNGLNEIKLDTNTFQVKNYNTSLGFKNKKINDVAFLNDTIYLATDNELIYFNQNYAQHRVSKPKCIINGLYSENEVITNNHKIDYSSNDISISYTGISFIDRGAVTYYYKFNGDKSWSQTNETQINYKSLEPKKHTFSIYCINGFDQKSSIKTISFTIKKPFWQKWWFFLIILISIISFFSMLWKWRLKYLKKQFEKERKAMFLENENIALENQMLALEQKALRLQMNPHFIFNALNTIKGYYSEGNVREASDYISKFSKLLRLLLENIEQYIPLHIEIEMLTLYLELTKVRYQDTFDYQITIEDSLKSSDVNIPTLLLQPLVENAIVHGIAPKKNKGFIQIDFKIKENSLISTVTDNGIGRIASSKMQNTHHNSKALDITKERLQLIEIQEQKSCQLQFIDLYELGIASGTTVKISIPIIKS